MFSGGDLLSTMVIFIHSTLANRRQCGGVVGQAARMSLCRPWCQQMGVMSMFCDQTLTDLLCGDGASRNSDDIIYRCRSVVSFILRRLIDLVGAGYATCSGGSYSILIPLAIFSIFILVVCDDSCGIVRYLNIIIHLCISRYSIVHYH
jgi:hypothetical protein